MPKILETLGIYPNLCLSFYGRRFNHNDEGVISSEYIDSEYSKKLIKAEIIKIIDRDYSLKKCIKEKIEDVKCLIVFLRWRWLWVSDYGDDGYKKTQECLKEYDSFLENNSIPPWVFAWGDDEPAARKIRKFFKKYCRKI